MLRITKIEILISVCIFFLLGCKSNTQNNIPDKIGIVDMYKREVTVPAKIERVFCADMTTTMLLYSLSPDLLIGTNNKLSEESKKYVTEEFYNLPELGRIFTGKSGINEEQLISMAPNVIICPVFRFTGKTDVEGFEKTAKRLDVPAIFVDMEMEKLADTYQFLGKLLNTNEKAFELAEYCKRTMKLADKTKKQINGSISFYIAEETNGLHTIPHGSAHSQIFELIGLNNCAKIDERYGYSDIQINMEQLIAWNPQIIFLSTREKAVSKNDIFKKEVWNTLNAVKNERIYAVPDKPFNWIGRPPGINRLIGIYWLVQQVEPELLEKNIVDETMDFFSSFYHVKLSKNEIEELLY